VGNTADVAQNASAKRLVRPPALRPGDKIAVIAPASAFDRAMFEAGCAELQRLGYRTVCRADIFDRDIYFAGSAERRVREFHEMWERDDVRAIICARGGYGCNYLLPRLDLELIRRKPKIFIGSSDITALLTYMHDSTGLVTFHGPMVAGDFARRHADETQFRAVLSSQNETTLKLDRTGALRGGMAEGTLYGGCLSILVASLGTPYEIQVPMGAILFLEDIGEPAYRLDRMLMQLKLAGRFRNVRGIIFGEMQGCTAPAGYELKDVLLRVIDDLDVPVVWGVKSGHVSQGPNVTLPIGMRAKLKVAGDVTLTFEGAVSE
jgi:muramoyltetrapeptide carboxypeptidase